MRTPVIVLLALSLLLGLSTDGEEAQGSPGSLPEIRFSSCEGIRDNPESMSIVCNQEGTHALACTTFLSEEGRNIATIYTKWRVFPLSRETVAIEGDGAGTTLIRVSVGVAFVLEAEVPCEEDRSFLWRNVGIRKNSGIHLSPYNEKTLTEIGIWERPDVRVCYERFRMLVGALSPYEGSSRRALWR